MLHSRWGLSDTVDSLLSGHCKDLLLDKISQMEILGPVVSRPVHSSPVLSCSVLLWHMCEMRKTLLSGWSKTDRSMNNEWTHSGTGDWEYCKQILGRVDKVMNGTAQITIHKLCNTTLSDLNTGRSEQFHSWPWYDVVKCAFTQLQRSGCNSDCKGGQCVNHPHWCDLKSVDPGRRWYILCAWQRCQLFSDCPIQLSAWTITTLVESGASNI